jgi:hypothetical protein
MPLVVLYHCCINRSFVYYHSTCFTLTVDNDPEHDLAGREKVEVTALGEGGGFPGEGKLISSTLYLYKLTNCCVIERKECSTSLKS